MDDPPILPSLDPTEVERTLYRRRDAPESLQPLQINYTNAQYCAENISNQSAPVTNKNVLLDANIHSSSASNHSLASNNTTATAHIESASNHSSRHSNSIHSPVQPVPGTLMITQTDIVPKLDLLTNPSDKNGDALSSNKSPANIGRISSQCSPVGSMGTAPVATALFDENISLTAHANVRNCGDMYNSIASYLRDEPTVALPTVICASAKSKSPPASPQRQTVLSTNAHDEKHANVRCKALATKLQINIVFCI